MTIASMVTGIASVVFIWIPYIAIISLPSAIVAIILGAISLGPINRGEQGGKGFAITGLVTGIVAVGLIILSLIFLSSAISLFGDGGGL